MLAVLTTERHDIPGYGLTTRYWVWGKLDQNVKAGELHKVFELQNPWRMEGLTLKVSFITGAEMQFQVLQAALRETSTCFCFSGYILSFMCSVFFMCCFSCPFMLSLFSF